MRGSASVVLAAVLAVAAGGCGGAGARPFRIGILSDCYGPFSSSHEFNLADAAVPLIEHGATPRGHRPSAGVEAVDVAGRRLELLVGCVAGNEDVIPEARRLVEEDGAAAVVGPIDPEQGMALRRYAPEQPNVAFLIQPSAAPEVTLQRPIENVFRFAPDAAQTSAGLGAYAYRRLGWRQAAVVGDDVPFGWEEAAGFVAEFCSLGGRIVARDWIIPGTDPAVEAARVPRTVDGVYVGAAVSPMQRFLQRYSALRHGLGNNLISNVALISDPAVIPSAHGVVVAGSPPFHPTRAARAFTETLRKAFPAIPAAAAINLLSLPYGTGVEAVVAALERSHGAGGRAFLTALARTRVHSSLGPIRLDGDRQAIVTNYLAKVVPAGNRFAVETIGVVPNVDHTFGGYFTKRSAPPSETSPPCVKRAPPPWAR
jgi:branched-chain amino acid transport system substrate-binding protein